MSRKDNIIQSITFKELHDRRINNFKKFLNDSIKDDKLKSILDQFSSMPTPIFMSKVKEVILPNKDNLDGFIKQLCSESEININKFDEETINKLIRFLEYFCASCSEYFS